MTKTHQKETDFRQDQKVVATIEIDDRGQDFIELDVLANGVLLGDSVMFKNGRLSLLGVGALDGMEYHTDTEIIQNRPSALRVADQYVYFYNTGDKKPLPWNASTLKYPVRKIKVAKQANRFVK